MKSMNSGLKCRVYSVRPTKDGEQWLPEKADSVARILFSDRSDRVADVIFFCRLSTLLQNTDLRSKVSHGF